MEIDREKALGAFRKYVDGYDADDEKVRLKIDHTLRVCGLCERIARESGFDGGEVEIGWLCGLLHDIGRFEQLRRYGTFSDAQSIDHAAFGADILFKDGRIRDYVADSSEDALLERVVRCHSAYRVPDDFDGRERRFADLLRDADKVDIIKVNVIVPLEEIYNVTTEELRNCTVSGAVMRAFREGHAIPRSLMKTPADRVVGHICLAYELVYPASYRIVREQGYLERLMDFRSEMPETMRQFQAIRGTIRAYLDGKQ